MSDNKRSALSLHLASCVQVPGVKLKGLGGLRDLASRSVRVGRKPSPALQRLRGANIASKPSQPSPAQRSPSPAQPAQQLQWPALRRGANIDPQRGANIASKTLQWDGGGLRLQGMGLRASGLGLGLGLRNSHLPPIPGPKSPLVRARRPRLDTGRVRGVPIPDHKKLGRNVGGGRGWVHFLVVP